METTTKKCSRCKCDKPLDCFGPNKRNKDGLHSLCLQCKEELHEQTKEKTCKRCELTKPSNDFSNSSRYNDGFEIYCKPCRVELQCQVQQRHPRRDYHKKWHASQKETAIAYYSNGEMKCSKCKLDDIRALTIDHINGGGQKHREEIKCTSIYRWLINHNYPAGFQVLCMSCQFIKRIENKEYDYHGKIKTEKVSS